MIRSPRRANPRALCCALLIAAITLFFCSKSSFGYPINDWTDANIYFSVGKGMLRGEVVYRDLYDHKGPILYALHALCALVSSASFIGVYVLEVLCLAAFLMLARRVLMLYGVDRAAWFALPPLSLAICTSFSFQQGDSAEELCLPLLLYTLYSFLKYAKRSKTERMSARELTLNGFLFGCVFWIKFTMVGLYAGFLLTLFLTHIMRREWGKAFSCLGWFIIGFLLSTLPPLVYFALNGAVLPWLKIYLYDNLFLYSGEDGLTLIARLKAMVRAGLDWLTGNPFYTLPLCFGLGWCVLRKEAARLERLGLPMMAALAALGVFIGGKSYPYYGLILAAFVPLCLIAPSRMLEKASAALANRGRWVTGLGVLFCALCLAACGLLSPNVRTSFAKPKESTMQYQLAAHMEAYPDASLLNYGFMDAGFYTAARLVPKVKYFHQTNVPLQEMLDEQVRYIEEGICDFVVTRGRQPDCLTENYSLIATADAPEDFWYDQVYLYQKK